jgi:hypothetical protein
MQDRRERFQVIFSNTIDAAVHTVCHFPFYTAAVRTCLGSRKVLDSNPVIKKRISQFTDIKHGPYVWVRKHKRLQAKQTETDRPYAVWASAVNEQKWSNSTSD